MPKKKEDLTGRRFGRLVVARFLGRDGKRYTWECRCDCGMSKNVQTGHLTGGSVRSCGCLPAGGFRHGMSYTATHIAWMSMRRRCEDPSNPDFHLYGGRGIAVCQRWQSFENFLADMSERPDGMTLDRFPNQDGNYGPGNCRWATPTQQANNRRTNRMVAGVTLAQAARAHGISAGTLRQRLEQGWTEERALATVVRSWGR